MFYDPVKDILAGLIRKYPSMRILFYKMLDIMFLRSWYVRRELRKIRDYFEDKEILVYDAGTGYGQYTYYISRKLQPAKIYAVDVKDQWIKDSRDFYRMKEIRNVDFSVEDLTEIDHKDMFDLIVCVDVMEHIADDEKVFRNFYNALKSDGFLLINTPSIFGGSDVHEEGESSFIEEHARTGYSHEDFESKLQPIGFSTYRYRYTYGFWGDKGWRLGIKYPIMLVNLSKFFFLILPLYYLITFPFTFLFMFADYITVNKVGSGITFIAKK